MSEEMKFPDTLDEFIKQYSFIDKEQIYTNGSELIQTFRIKQWEEHKKQENQSLKKQLEEYKNELEKADSITQSCIFNGKKESEISYRKCLNMLEKHKNQQKEFIKHLENEIYSIEPKGTGINYNCEYDSEEDYIKAMKEQSRLNTLKEILSKYKEIIGGKE